MEVKHLSSIHEKSFQDVSFTLRKGEILGFGGLVGAQRTELLEGVFGMRAIQSGEIYIKGKKVNIKHPADAMKAGIGLITEDRRGNGIFGCLSIKDNVGVSTYNKYLKAGIVLDHKKIGEIVDIVDRNLESNLDYGEMIWFGERALGLKEGSIRFHNLPGDYTGTMWSPTYQNYQSYVFVNSSALRDLINQYMNPYLEDITPDMQHVVQDTTVNNLPVESDTTAQTGQAAGDAAQGQTTD